MKAAFVLLAGLIAAPVHADVLICTTDQWCLTAAPDECADANETVVILAEDSRLGLNFTLPGLASGPEIIGPQTMIGGDLAPPSLTRLLPDIDLPENAHILLRASPIQIDPQTGLFSIVAPAVIFGPADHLTQPHVTLEIAIDFSFRALIDRALLGDQTYTGSCVRAGK